MKACGDEGLSVTQLSNRLFIRRHTAVELSMRLVEAGLVTRTKAAEDQRRVLLHVTPRGEAILAALASVHREQLGRQSRDLIGVLQKLAPDADPSA